jgi:predicted CoA-binding protein
MYDHSPSVDDFLGGRRIAVAGVSRTPAAHSGNAVYRGLRERGYEVFPVNPHTEEVEGARCYHTVRDVPGPLDGVVVATHPRDAIDVVRQCAERGVKRLWFHRSFGAGSVSEDALRECRALGIEAIVGGCPLMHAEPVDVVHRCARWWLRWRRHLPA